MDPINFEDEIASLHTEAEKMLEKGQITEKEFVYMKEVIEDIRAFLV